MSLNIRSRNGVIYGYFFCLLVRNSCVHICMYRRFTSAGIYALYVYMNPDVEFKKVSKIVFYAILTMLGINFTKKNQNCLQNWLQESDANSKFNT